MRTIPAVLLAIAAAVPLAAQAAETLYVGGPGGSSQKAFEEKIVPAFEKKTGAKVVYVPGNSSDLLAKLVAQKAKPEMSLAIIDEGPMFMAIERDLCATVENKGSVKDIYDAARMPGGKAVGVGLYASGLGYNQEVFARNGWAPPTSWLDLTDPKYKGKVSVTPVGGYGLHSLVMLARLNGGSEDNIDPGFEVMANKVAPNVIAFEASPANMAQLLQTGEAALVAWGDLRVQAVADQGAKVAFVYPKEGAVRGMTAACVVEGAPQPKLAQLFLEEVLSPTAQVELAKAGGYGPVNPNAKLDPAVAKKVVYGPEQAAALIPLKYTTINPLRAEWAKRWNRQVER